MKLIFLLALVPGVCSAVDIRSYTAARHDRFISGATGLQIRPTAYYNPGLYTALGYAGNPGDVRQFALVSPEHVLFARHFSSGGVISFLNSDGAVFSRNIAANIDVPNGAGGISDLVIMKLSAPIGKPEKITPFPYLNLTNEAAYTNTVLVVFGQNRRAGRGTIGSFSDFEPVPNPSGINPTRSYTFTHSPFFGNADDAVAVSGDSGSPSFAMANGKPALVGVHLAASKTALQNSTVDTFVPHYAVAVNQLLAPEGYQLIPAYPKAVTLSASITGSPLVQVSPGNIGIIISNTDPDTATNVRVELDFPANAIPTSISAPGWIVQSPTPGSFHLRTATMAGNSSTTVTVAYSAIPVLTEIPFVLVRRSDGSPELSENFTVPIRQSFAGFVSALPAGGQAADPDGDEVSNLLEYALGGDPAVSSALNTNGGPLAPVCIASGGSVSFIFSRRTDAALRGLSYEVEFSQALELNSWSTVAPAGASTMVTPDGSGFEKVTVTLPTTAASRYFFRLKILLNE